MFHLQSLNQKCNDSVLLMGIDTIYNFSFSELQREKIHTTWTNIVQYSAYLTLLILVVMWLVFSVY